MFDDLIDFISAAKHIYSGIQRADIQSVLAGVQRLNKDETTVFAYKMEGATLEADWWMTNKLAASRLTGMSSLRALTASRARELEASWKVREENFFVCGGCIPVFMRDGSRPFAYVMVSGMEHWDDHQVIADAMAKQLGVEIPEIRKEQP